MTGQTRYIGSASFDRTAGVMPGLIDRAPSKGRRDAGREDHKAADAARPRLESAVPPDYRDIPIEQVPSAVLAGYYRELALHAADYQRAGVVMLQAVAAATALLDKGDIRAARAVLVKLLDAAKEGNHGVH